MDGITPAPAPAKNWRKPGPPKGTKPTGKVGRPKGQMIFKEPQQALFLQHYAETRNITHSAKLAGVSWFCVHDLRRRSPDFHTLMLKAEAEYVDKIVAEAHRRAVEGVEETRYGSNGPIGVVRRYSDRLLEILLKRYAAEFRETTTTRVEHAHVVDLDALVRRLPAEKRSQLREILALASSTTPPAPDYSEFRPRAVIDAEAVDVTRE